MKSISTTSISLKIMTILIPLFSLAQIPTGYYDQAEGLTGPELKAALHHIVSDHIRYPYTSTSTDVWDILKETDEDPANSDNVILIYTGRSQLKTENSGESSTAGSNRWNREHIWSKSHGFPSETDTAYTDIHHLRPADESVNSSRSNLDFDQGGNPHVEATGCNYDSDSWEPRDEVKGDVARMMFYMVVRYDPGYHSDNSLYDLELVDYAGVEIGLPPGEPLFGKLSTLLIWHAADPVDEFEQNRHEIIYDYQGNRNPFVDHPQWADSIFAGQLAPNTRIGFFEDSEGVEEDIGVVTLEVSIVNPDPVYDTSCEITLTGGNGDSADINGFDSALMTFPAGSAALQTLDLIITDDDLAEEQETFIFTITNVTGGDSASTNGRETFVLTINPSDQLSVVHGLIISEVMDGNRTGGHPKFLEITNTTLDGIDISGYQIWRGSNGSEPINVVEIPSGTMLAGGASWVITYYSSELENAGFNSPDQTSTSINGNGDDVYQLRTASGNYVDAFGLVGTMTEWYKDSYAVRNAAVNTGSANFDPAEWTTTTLSSGMPSGGSPGTPGTHIFEPWVGIDEKFIPGTQRLISAYPNPFNPEVTISYVLDNDADSARLDIYDLQGGLIKTLSSGYHEKGAYDLTWDGTNMKGQPAPSGIYLVCYSSHNDTRIQRVTLLR